MCAGVINRRVDVTTPGQFSRRGPRGKLTPSIFPGGQILTSTNFQSRPRLTHWENLMVLGEKIGTERKANRGEVSQMKLSTSTEIDSMFRTAKGRSRNWYATIGKYHMFCEPSRETAPTHKRKQLTRRSPTSFTDETFKVQ